MLRKIPDICRLRRALETDVTLAKELAEEYSIIKKIRACFGTKRNRFGGEGYA